MKIDEAMAVVLGDRTEVEAPSALRRLAGLLRASSGKTWPYAYTHNTLGMDPDVVALVTAVGNGVVDEALAEMRKLLADAKGYVACALGPAPASGTPQQRADAWKADDVFKRIEDAIAVLGGKK